MSSTQRMRMVCSALLFVGGGLVFVFPRYLVFGIVTTVTIAVFCSLRITHAPAAQVVRNGLLALTAFGYPVFLGGVVLPWLLLVLHLVLISIAWSHNENQELTIAQALAAGFGIAITTAALQFFFPGAWRWVAMLALIAFFALITASLPERFSRGLPSPTICAIVLVLSESLVILRYLPTHWIINGAILALALAATIHHERTPRYVFVAILVAVFVLGAVPW
ncbi:MAG: hypothetical protein ABIG71_04355 [Candidatus Uhrbacteria bacterium]